jgi:hypothetical protein
MSRENVEPVYAIGAFRTVGGVSAWFAPNLLARVYGGAMPDAGSLLWSRLASSREIALALGPIMSESEERRRWLLLGLACDFADITATLVGNRRCDRLSRRSTGLALATYSVSALLTVSALRSVRRQAHTDSLEAAGLSE